MSFLKVTPPPIIYGASFLLGGLLHLLYAPLLPFRAASLIVGWLLVGFSFVLIFPVLSQFRRAKTTFDVRKKPQTLISSGFYKYSRNPTYLSLSMLYLGGALLLGSAMILILLMPCILIIDRLVIPNEELNLEAEFSDEFRAYKLSVRRWI